jgi:hypothetical protein
MHRADWDTCTAQELAAVLRGGEDASGPGLKLDKTNTYDYTYGLKLREGRLCLLKVAGQSKSLQHGVWIRYKLVPQPQPASVIETALAKRAARDKFQFRWVAAAGDVDSPMDILPDASDRRGRAPLRVLRDVVLSSLDVESAGFSQYQSAQKLLEVLLTARGRDKFAQATAQNIHRQLAIVWREQVICAPIVQSAISNGHVSIPCVLSDTEAQQFLDVLNHRANPVALNSATPVDLTAYCTTPTSRFDDVIGFPAWKSVPRGFQVFNQVPLQIDGMICLWGEGNTQKLKINFPGMVPNIALNRKFDTLYIYHGAFFKSPEGTPVCAVVFRYEDGSSVTNQMRYGSDIVDWIAKTNAAGVIGPMGPNSRLAWVNGSFTPGTIEPLRLCLTALENPKPDLRVAAIDLYSCRSQTAISIMAVTTGPSGLMK